jgi:glycosyltransferase involved in cell wall biosynthesis
MTLSKPRPIKILHVLGSLNRGGVETWLMHMLRHIDRDSFHFDFLVNDDSPGAYDNEARSLGSQIVPCLEHKRPWVYARNFQKALDRYGPYDVIHSHVHHYSGYVLRLAHQIHIPRRIAHSHNDTLQKQEVAGFGRKLYFQLMKKWVRQYSTVRLASSPKAAEALYGHKWHEAATVPTQLLFYGLDFSRFHERVSPVQVRTELGIPVGGFVIGHVGRFVEQKNHDFILEIAKETIGRHNDTFFLLVGEGKLKEKIQQNARQLGISEKLIFTGVRSDVPRLMLGAMDVFLLPSHHEGLGIVLVEAQAAGLPCIVSDVVPNEADVIERLVKRLPLEGSVKHWADELFLAKQLVKDRPQQQKQALVKVEDSIFSIKKCMEQLRHVYSNW